MEWKKQIKEIHWRAQQEMNWLALLIEWNGAERKKKLVFFWAAEWLCGVSFEFELIGESNWWKWRRNGALSSLPQIKFISFVGYRPEASLRSWPPLPTIFNCFRFFSFALLLSFLKKKVSEVKLAEWKFVFMKNEWIKRNEESKRNAAPREWHSRGKSTNSSSLLLARCAPSKREKRVVLFSLAERHSLSNSRRLCCAADKKKTNHSFNLFFFSSFSCRTINLWLIGVAERMKKRVEWYYNSKYIDAEETDVSRNQTSTWLIDDWRLLMKQRYSGGERNQQTNLLFSLRMRKDELVLMEWAEQPPKKNEWMKENLIY